MLDMTARPSLAETTSRRAVELFEEHRLGIFRRIDRLFAGILVFEWAFGIFLAFTVSPRAWAGPQSSVHPHVWAALLLGGAFMSLPVWLAIHHPGRTLTRHVIASAQMLISALLIHLTGGRIETHFHVFGSLAFLAFYRDWRVFIPATLVVALDHFLRGVFWPQSVYGVLTPSSWRWLEHAGWVAFEDVFLIRSCIQSVTEMRGIARRQAQLEATNQIVEEAVKERTHELAESEERFEAFMDNSPAVASMKDESGKYVYVNRAFEQAFQVTRDQVAGTTDRERWASEIAAQIEESDRKVLARGQGLESLESVPAPDGTPHQWNVHRFVVVDAMKRRLIGGIALDMTEKLRLAEQLRQSQRMEAVGRLAGGIAHDFNNLLATVTGYARLLLPRLQGNDSLHRYAGEIAKAAERAAELTRQMLAYTRQQMLQPEVIDLNAVLTRNESLLRDLIGDGIELVLTPDSHLRQVLADPGQIEQVIANLVSNARDAMPDGGRLTIETANVEMDEDAAGHEGGAEPGACVMLSVGDTGHGMDAETKARIFEPFFTTKPVGKGTGLGLSTVHGIVHQSGGHMVVESGVSAGTTFKIYLPVHSEVATERGGMDAAVEASRGSEVVLLVDDEDGVRSLASEVLQGQGYEVIEARHGEEAIELSQRHGGEIDVLVTDVVMTGMSGRQLADLLCQSRPRLKVLFMSGYPGDAVVRHGLLRPGNEFIQKPFMPESLTSKLRELLDRQQVA